MTSLPIPHRTASSILSEIAFSAQPQLFSTFALLPLTHIHSPTPPQALNVLKGFYEKSAGTALVQSKQEPAGPPPPAGFKAYENNAGGNSVIAMITQIINDAKAMEAECIHDEEDAQRAYEDMVKNTNDTINAKNKDIVSKQADKAAAEGDKTNAEGDLSNTQTELEQLSNELADLHKGCDFVLKNFDIRQEARGQEVEALRQAKAILSGANFGFMQKN
jgi:hypothetical protein